MFREEESWADDEDSSDETIQLHETVEAVNTLLQARYLPVELGLPIFSLQNYEFEEGDLILECTQPHESSVWDRHPVPDMQDCFTMYKRVDQKIKPVPALFPQEAMVKRQFPHDPLEDLPMLSTCPPEFSPTARITQERMDAFKLDEGFLQPEEIKLFQQVILNNEKTLPYEEKDRGILSQEYFSDYIMPTVEHIPWSYKNIPIPPAIVGKVIELLKNKVEAGVYESCQSSYRCRWFCVLKKNGTLRLIHDLQPLNQVSIRDAGLLPVLDEFVEPYGGSQCCTVFDLFWGYDARRVHEKSRDMTAFYTPLGLLRLTCLPMGYTNSPAEFQRCMTFILQDEIPDVANIFIDDLPIRGPRDQYLDEAGEPATLADNPGIRKFIWEHANDVNRIMHRIHKAGATFSPNKSQICKPVVEILGQTCSAQGRSMDKSRVDKILKWPVPKNLKELRGFTGLCGTVRIWIKDYSLICRPLTFLTRKGQPYDWGDDQQAAFEKLKVLVTSAPALKAIDYNSSRPIILSVDSSFHAVGMVLSQEDEKGKRHPARYGSIPFTQTESRYSQAKLELYGLYRAMTAWKQYLIGAENLVVEVDAKYLKGMINRPDLQPAAPLNRWISGILLYHFKLVHVPATRFQAPDALSRRPLASDEEPKSHDDSWLDDVAFIATDNLGTIFPGMSMYASSEETPTTSLTEEIPDYESLSPPDQNLLDIAYLLDQLQTHPRKKFPSLQSRKRFAKQATEFFLNEGKLYKRNGQLLPLRVILNPAKRKQLITQSHDQLGHKGEQAVFDLLKLRFYWPRLRSDVHQHITSCHTCQIRSLKRLQAPLGVSTPPTIFSKAYLDVMVMTPSGPYSFIVACKDDLTGVTEARAMVANKSTHVAKFLWEQIYCRYGCIGQVITDNGKEVAGAFALLMERLNIPHVRIAPYNKRANGVVERGHYILREAIVRSCPKRPNGDPKNWHEILPLAVFADRITISSVTNYSPFFLLHGVDPILPFDLSEATFLFEGYHSGMTTEELLTLRIRHLGRHEEDLKLAAENLRIARFRSKRQFNRRFKKRMQRITFKQGDLVLIHNSRLDMTISRHKYNDRYLGPYEIVEKTPRGYRIQELDGTASNEIIAPSRLLPYITREDPVIEELAEGLPPITEIGDTPDDGQDHLSSED